MNTGDATCGLLLSLLRQELERVNKELANTTNAKDVDRLLTRRDLVLETKYELTKTQKT